ncbi:MAG: response regulator [Nostoc sp. TH1S01]|nr:response regulator [Nostoc sp. TH1S01]
MKILIVEDDTNIIEILRVALSEQHYLVEVATDGKSGLELALATTYNLIVLGVSLPIIDGISICKQLRNQGCCIPVLLLIEVDNSTQSIAGLDAGADDYVIKPFNLEELLARIRALLRRGMISTTLLIEFGALRLDPSSCQITYAGKILPLTAKEYALLELLLRNSRRIFSQSSLLEHLWSFDEIPSENTVRSHIRSLRSKLKKAGAKADLIETVYGCGYRLNTQELDRGNVNKIIETEKPKHSTKADQENSINSQLKQQITAQLAGIWQRYQYQYSDRLAIIEQAAQSLLTNTLTEDLRQQAQQQAHTLAGSLGSFGFDNATRLCQNIETILKLPEKLNKIQAEQIRTLLMELKNILEQNPTLIPPQSGIKPPYLNQKYRLLIVDDDLQTLDILRTILQPWGFTLTLLDDPQYFWDTLEQFIPDMLILDLEMPKFSGIDLCQVVRNDPRWSNLPVLFLSAHRDMQIVQSVFAAGADDYVTKPIVEPELLARVLCRLERSQIIRKFAEIDALTGITNRRKSVQELNRLLHLAERQNQPFYFAVLDLDRFKYINDQYGHDAGDQVLSQLGKLLKQSFRQEDVVARWGGEEFVVGLYGITQQQVLKRLNDFLDILRRIEFTTSNQKNFNVTISGGVAEFPKDGHDVQTLYRSADSALYQAKAAGRDQIFLSSSN